jgi:hypothetical protein
MRTLRCKMTKGARCVVPPALFGVLTAAAVAAGLQPIGGHSAQAIGLRVKPASQAVAPGSAAKYGIKFDRRRFRGRVVFRVIGLPARTRARVTFTRRLSTRGTLTIFTRASTRAGRYRLRLQAASGRRRQGASLGLTVRRARALPFQITGGAGALQPGSSQALNLSLRNPNRVGISVTRLVASVSGVAAPRATAAQPCGVADFVVQQYRGPYPLALPPRSTRTLAELGIAPSAQPRIALLNRPVNQDRCQGATLTLAYGGTAVHR